MNFLRGINDSFSQVRTQIFLMDPFPFLYKVYSLMIQEETQRFVIHCSNPKVESIVLVTKSQNVNVNSRVNYVGNNGNKGKEKPVYKRNQFTPTVVSLVTLLISAISFMDFLLVTSSRAKLQWHIK